MSDIQRYARITAAYWAFTLTDGALRMLVLLHFHTLGYDPIEIAFLFLLYEAMGISTNFVGGWIGSRFGLKLTLYSGLAIQVGALVMLSLVQPDWPQEFSVAYVMASQAFSGIAKDLTKMSSKSAVKLVVKEDSQSLLFKWVALLTGSKNALKGAGFFLGGFLLSSLGFQVALWSMASVLAVVLLFTGMTLQGDLGRAKEKITAKDLFSKTRSINILSAARIFLFASRDVWFVVGVPIFMTSILGWGFTQVSGFMAAWIIGYGIVQASVPKVLRRTTDELTGTRAAQVWVFILAFLPAIIALGLSNERTGLELPPSIVLVGGLGVFAVVFAINSTIHSYLIVSFSDKDKIALNVGFYYMANAIGRLFGTFLSGAVYQYAGITACLWVSALLVLTSALISLGLPKPQGAI